MLGRPRRTLPLALLARGALLPCGTRHRPTVILPARIRLGGGPVALCASSIGEIAQSSLDGEERRNNGCPLNPPVLEPKEQYVSGQVGESEDDCHPQQQDPSMACRRQKKAPTDSTPASRVI
jgi:hypothetical protein